MDKMIYHSSVVVGLLLVINQNAGNFYQGKSTLKVLGMDTLDYVSWPKYNKCFLNLSIFNSVDSGQWVEDPVAEFGLGINAFGHTIVGETTLVAAGGYTGSYQNSIVLLQPNTGRRTLSSTLPTSVRYSCSIAINPTSKLGE